MDPQIARMIMILLNRTSLQGSEVKDFIRIMQVLESIANPPPEIPHEASKEIP